MSRAQDRTVAAGGVAQVEDFIAALPEKRREEARVQGELIVRGMADLGRKWPVEAG